MSKNEIRLRRHKLTSRGADRFRNYGEVLHRHEKETRLRKMMRAVAMFLIILILMVLIVIVVRLEKRAAKNTQTSVITSLFRNQKVQYSPAHRAEQNFQYSTIPKTPRLI